MNRREREKSPSTSVGGEGLDLFGQGCGCGGPIGASASPSPNVDAGCSWGGLNGRQAGATVGFSRLFMIWILRWLWLKLSSSLASSTALPAGQAAHRHQETTTLALVFRTGSVRPGCPKTFARGPGSECLVGPARLGAVVALGSGPSR